MTRAVRARVRASAAPSWSPSVPVGDGPRVLAAPETHVGLGQVGGDAEGVVQDVPAAVGRYPLLENPDDLGEVSPRQGARRLREGQGLCHVGHLRALGEPSRLGQRPQRVVVQASGGRFPGQHLVGDRDDGPVAQLGPELGGLTGVGVGALVVPEESPPGRREREGLREDAERTKLTSPADPAGGGGDIGGVEVTGPSGEQERGGQVLGVVPQPRVSLGQAEGGSGQGAALLQSSGEDERRPQRRVGEHALLRVGAVRGDGQLLTGPEHAVAVVAHVAGVRQRPQRGHPVTPLGELRRLCQQVAPPGD